MVNMEVKEVHSFSFRNIFIDTFPLLYCEGLGGNTERVTERGKLALLIVEEKADYSKKLYLVYDGTSWSPRLGTSSEADSGHFLALFAHLLLLLPLLF